MAIVRPMWLTGGMSGRADKTSNTYTKQTSITGKTVAVTLRNPVGYDKQGEKVIAAQNKFHALSTGVSTFYRRISAIGASAEDQALYKSLVSFVRGQHRYGTVRGYLMAKCATVNEDFTQVKIVYRDHEETINVSFQARGVVRNPEDDGFTESGNHGTTDGGNGGNTDGSSVDPAPVNPNPAAGETYSIQAGVSADGGGSVSITKNGVAVAGNSVEATASDTVVLTATEDEGFQFLGWSDSNHQNPRTIQPSADMDVKAAFLDLSKV